jgi:hypothetical protein
MEVSVADTGVGIAPRIRRRCSRSSGMWGRRTRRWKAPGSGWPCPGSSSTSTGADLGDEPGGRRLDLRLHVVADDQPTGSDCLRSERIILGRQVRSRPKLHGEAPLTKLGNRLSHSC